MEYCYKCEIPEAKALLFDVVLPDGIYKICRKCSYKEDLPIITKPNLSNELEKRPTVYERLSKLSGFDAKKKSENEELKKEEAKLKEVVNRKFRRTVVTVDLRTNLRDELIDNFHWIVMRVRRGKHLTQKQVAEAIRESEISIRMLERGIVNDANIIKKIEEFLSIRIRKKIEETPQEIERPKFETDEEIDNFDKDDFRGLTIQDLQEMKQDKEAEIFDTDSEDIIELEKIEEDDDGKPL